MLSLPTKERKAKFNTDDLVFRKESNLPFRTLLYLQAMLIEDFKDKIKDLKSILNEMKN